MTQTATVHVTPELVAKAYGALATGDKQQCLAYWDEDMVWLVPGHNQVSGWKFGLDAFLAFMAKVGELSDHSFNMESIAIMCNDEFSTDVTRNTGYRAGNPSKRLDIDVAHVLHWRNGKVVAGKGGIFGDGTAQYDEFWS
jgi:ketosteroid isomerase-like protein